MKELKLRFSKFECSVAFVPSDASSEVIFMCDACLTMFTQPDLYAVHCTVCAAAGAESIIGDVTWYDEKRSLFVVELDGRKSSCAPTCWRVAKLATYFLDHKMTVDDVHFFGFFCLFLRDGGKNHFVGYFSKEWDVSSAGDNNLACLFVLPSYQGLGYGKLLISLSYSLSALEHRPGTPERPFSEQGARSYDRYWRKAVGAALLNLGKKGKPITTQALCEATHMVADDVLVTLRRMKQPKTLRKAMRAPLFVLPSAKEDSEANFIDPATLTWCGVEPV
jgi:GNAT superfamily N-acetyltransferase